MIKLFAFIIGMLLSAQAWSANYSNPVDGIFKSIYGDTLSVEIVSEVSKSSVSDPLEKGDLSFQFNANTGYKNFHQLSELKEGDRVRVEYNESGSKGKQLVATSITKLSPSNSTDVVQVRSIATTPTVTEVRSTDTAPGDEVTTTTTTTTTY